MKEIIITVGVFTFAFALTFVMLPHNGSPFGLDPRRRNLEKLSDRIKALENEMRALKGDVK